jgi:membrane fusion protein, multidrug efflux system
MRSISRIQLIAAVGVLITGLLSAGCDKPNAANATPRPSPPEVGIVVVTPQPVSITKELPGRTSAYLVAEVRPQVGGIIQHRLFDEGADVKAGQVLYQINDASYRAAYASASAALAKADANRVPARLKADRLQELVKINAVSQQDFDDAAAAFKLAEAEVAAATAAMETARINLAYTAVKAPISGRIGRSEVTTGALVTASQAAPLATIQQLDPVYVDVTQSTAELLRLQHELTSGALKTDADGQPKVQLVLEDGTNYPLAGTMKFSDVTVNQSTGSVTLRTLFPNPQHLLLPGMYVRAIVQEGVMAQGILVPQQGVSRNPAGNAVAMVVGAQDKVEPRILQIAQAIGDQWLVSAGLQAGDRLIVEGLQKARPGTQVRTVAFGSKPAVTTEPKAAKQ